MCDSGIYAIENKLNGEVYIGSTKNFKSRWSQHKGMLIKNSHHSKPLQKAVQECGLDNFVFYILEEVEDTSTLISKEQEYFDTFKPYHEDFGYNMAHKAGKPSFDIEALYNKNTIKKEDFQKILDLRKNNFTMGKIGLELGYDESVIYIFLRGVSRLSRIINPSIEGFSKIKIPKETKNLLMEMFLEGRSLQEIHQVTGIKPVTITGILTRKGFKKPFRGIDEVPLLEDIRRGMICKEAMEKYGISQNTFYTRKRKLKLIN